MNKDIFNDTIIKYKDIENNLVQIFTDSIITDTQFRIIDISDSVVEMLKFKKPQVLGKHISKILFGNSSELILLLNSILIKLNVSLILIVYFWCLKYFLGSK